MVFKPGGKPYTYEIIREAGENVLYVNYFGSYTLPDIARDALTMARAFDLLLENPNVSKIVFVQFKNYVYDLPQLSFIFEFIALYNYLINQIQIFSPRVLSPFTCKICLGRKQDAMRYLFLTLIKRDPISCYVELKRLIREEKLNKGKTGCTEICENHYLMLLEKIRELFEKTKIIMSLKEKLEGYKVGSRKFYDEFFKPIILPNFVFTKLITALPEQAEIIEEYEIGDPSDKAYVTILRLPESTKYFYHLTPSEYVLEENYANLVNLARNVLIEHQPKQEEFTDPARIRQIFFNISRDLLSELAQERGIKISYRQLIKLSRILVRSTIGFGILEILLQDDRLQDIVVNAPSPQNPIFVRHQDYDECDTNIFLSQEDTNSWAAKFRMISGRPLDEANPILDTELEIENAKARVAIIQQPLSPYGLAYAFRRHREKPWTLPLFIYNKMINPLGAGLLSFLVDGARTMLIAGTRSSGKTSLLGACILEIMPKYRIVVVEDTLELPVDSIRKLNYDILRMKVRSALVRETTEVSASDGIRTSLRLGDSSLIVGEVRSEEALALYEAMRVGALANVVAGTIHGASPYGVFDRVVNDLKVPATSFKATDLIMIANPIKSPDGLHRWRRVLQLTEVRKHWQQDPSLEGGFVDLLKYDVASDELKATPELVNGESEIVKAIAANVKGWAGNWDAVWDNIMLRAKIKEMLVDYGRKLNALNLLEADFVVKANNAFHRISDEVREEVGLPLSKYVLPKFEEWLKSEIKKI
ncbi:MAG: type II/IV secretion system ATPase subunit [Candidatus Pacearchaeota archaeon]